MLQFDMASLEEAALLVAEGQARRRFIRNLIYYLIIALPVGLTFWYFNKELHQQSFTSVTVILVFIMLLFCIVDRYQLYMATGLVYLLLTVTVTPYYALTLNGLIVLFTLSILPSLVALLSGMRWALVSLASIYVIYLFVWFMTVFVGYEFPIKLSPEGERQLLLLHWSTTIILHAMR